MTNEMMMPSFDGTKLYLKRDIPEASRAVAVIVHGLCEHQGRYDYLAEKLNEKGYAVFRFDHRGHGRSEGKRVYYGNFNELVDDVNEVVKLAEAEYPGLPLFVIGHSMGGFASTLFATKYPGRARGFVLSGALTRGNKTRKDAAAAAARGEAPPVLPADAYVPNALGDGVCGDPAVVEAYVNDPLVEKQISVALMNNLGAGVAWLAENPDKFTDPVLILHGANDGLVDEQDSRELFGEIAAQDKGLIIYPKLLHEIFNEKERDEVIGHALAWMEKRI